MPSLKLRVGSKCNQNCKFCHSNKGDDYEFNPKIIPFIKYNNFGNITYGGGEPLMYWDIIKYIIESLPNIHHTIVTNGSLFNEECLSYCLKYNIQIFISLTDYTNITDETYKIISKVPQLGTSKLYDGTKSFQELDELVNQFKLKIGRSINSYWYNLMHTTCNNPTYVYTQEMKDHYVSNMKKRIKNALYSRTINRPTRWSCMNEDIHKFLIGRKIQGCNNYYHTTISLDGRFMPCSYIAKYGVSIEDLYNYDIPKLKSEDCYKCPLMFRCHTCYKTLNNDQCEIYNELYSYIKDICNEYNLDIDKL